MENYLLDTNVFIYAFNGIANDKGFLSDLLRKRDLYISTVVLAEIYASPLRRHRIKIDKLLDISEVIPVNKSIAILAGKLRRIKMRKRTKTYLTDCLIAATALYKNCTLVTHNVKDFRFPKLQVIKPKKEV